MPRTSPFVIALSSTEEQILVETSRQYTAPHYKVVRAKIVLLAASGMENEKISERLDVPRQIVSKWRKRFFFERLDGLEDQPRCGRTRSFSPSEHCGHQSPRL
jgi:transposase-like protein